MYAGAGQGLVEGMAVVLGEDGTIAAVQPIDRVDRASAARTWDFDGCTVLPGLIDMHGHFLEGADPNVTGDAGPDTITAETLRAVGHAGDCLRAGITSVRDLGARTEGIFRLQASIDEGKLEGPRIFPSGVALTSTGGHAVNLIARAVDGVDAVRAAVRRQAAAGARWIKLMVTRGAGSMGKAMDEVQFSAEELAAAVSEAHRLRRRVSAHAIGVEGVKAALTAGVDSIEHGLLIDAETVQLMRETGASFCPTLDLYRRIEAMVAAGDFPLIPKLDEAIAEHPRTIRRAHEIGVPILAGTDAGGVIGFGGVAREVDAIAQSGVPAAVAIAAATETAARCLGAADLGRIEPSCVADLVVVRGNPLENPKCLSEVVIVIKDGRVVFNKGDLKCPEPQ